MESQGMQSLPAWSQFGSSLHFCVDSESAWRKVPVTQAGTTC